MASKQDLMRHEIREAATRLFIERGITSVTLKDVAAEVGISKASIYNYFDTKDDLIGHVFGDWAEQSVVPFRAIAESDADPATKLRDVVRLRIEQMVGESSLFALSIQEQHRLPPAIRDDFRRSKRVADHLIQDIIRDGQERGVFVDLDVHLVEFALMGMCNWLWAWYDAAGDQSVDSVANTFVHILLRGISTDTYRADSDTGEIARRATAIREQADALIKALTR